MDYKHLLVAVALFVVGFAAAKKWPTLFSSIPGLNMVTG